MDIQEGSKHIQPWTVWHGSCQSQHTIDICNPAAPERQCFDAQIQNQNSLWRYLKEWLFNDINFLFHISSGLNKYLTWGWEVSSFISWSLCIQQTGVQILAGDNLFSSHQSTMKYHKVLYVYSHEKRISAILFSNVKYKDLCGTINP